MKRFVFSLNSVLRLREFYREQAEMELARAISESERIKLLLEENAQNRRRANLNRSGADLPSLVAIEHYIQRLDLNTESLLKEAAAAELIIEEKRKILAEKMKESKVLNNLKDRRRAEYRKENLQEQDIVLDDLVNSGNRR